MEEIRYRNESSLQDSDAFKTFTRRFARRLLLKQHCHTKDHPVLMIEEDLTEMARSKFQEQLLAKIPSTRLKRLKSIIEKMIQKAVQERILFADEEEDVKLRALDSIRTEDFGVFLVVH